MLMMIIDRFRPFISTGRGSYDTEIANKPCNGEIEKKRKWNKNVCVEILRVTEEIMNDNRVVNKQEKMGRNKEEQKGVASAI